MTTIANGAGDNRPNEGDGFPEYRVALSIYDNKTGETVCKSTTYFGEEGGVTELQSLLRFFDREARQSFEAVHYPKEGDSE